MLAQRELEHVEIWVTQNQVSPILVLAALSSPRSTEGLLAEKFGASGRFFFFDGYLGILLLNPRVGHGMVPFVEGK